MGKKYSIKYFFRMKALPYQFFLYICSPKMKDGILLI